MDFLLEEVKMRHIKKSVLATLVIFPSLVFGEQTDQLEPIHVTAKMPKINASLSQSLKPSDHLIEGKVFKERSTTIGEALANQIGIHANPFGGGASAPVIRGQEGNRIKVLQNNAEMIDMSAMSPDHAMMVDSILSKQIEIIRGAPTLLYSSGNIAGVVNVIDEKIPTSIPEKGYKGEVGIRYGTNNREKIISSGITLDLGQQFALRLEGLNRKSNDYRVPKSTGLLRIGDSWADSNVGSVGLSWIKDKSYIGVAFTDRQDKYGLPAHNHEYEHCHADVIIQSKLITNNYLQLYPHLLEENEVDYNNPGLGCGFHYGHNHEEHAHGNPWIDLHSKRYDLRAEIDQPFVGFETLRATLSQVDYKHDEKDGNYVSGFFKNRGQNARVELVHKPIYNIKGVLGIQYLTQKTSATGAKPELLRQELLINNQAKRVSAFAIEQWNWKNVSFEIGSRVERQVAKIDYDMDLINERNYMDTPLPSLAPHRQTAHSYSGSATWNFAPDHTISIIASHQERLPTTQELYAHGKHLATNAFEIGNKNLRKEQSNNIELALGYTGDKLDYRFSIYHNNFKNYIYAKTLNAGRGAKSIESYKDVRLNRYMQSGAKFYGIEGEINYQATPIYQLSLFGDYVRGKLVNIPDIPGPAAYFKGPNLPIPQADRNAPRVPPARLGMRVNANFTTNYSASLEYYRMFNQNKTADFENSTKGHHMLNLGMAYEKTMNETDWRVFVKADNVLNQKVYSHTSFLSDLPQMGRNFTVGLNVNF